MHRSLPRNAAPAQQQVEQGKIFRFRLAFPFVTADARRIEKRCGRKKPPPVRHSSSKRVHFLARQAIVSDRKRKENRSKASAWIVNEAARGCGQQVKCATDGRPNGKHEFPASQQESQQSSRLLPGLDFDRPAGTGRPANEERRFRTFPENLFAQTDD